MSLLFITKDGNSTYVGQFDDGIGTVVSVMKSLLSHIDITISNIFLEIPSDQELIKYQQNPEVYMLNQFTVVNDIIIIIKSKEIVTNQQQIIQQTQQLQNESVTIPTQQSEVVEQNSRIPVRALSEINQQKLKLEEELLRLTNELRRVNEQWNESLQAQDKLKEEIDKKIQALSELEEIIRKPRLELDEWWQEQQFRRLRMDREEFSRKLRSKQFYERRDSFDDGRARWQQKIQKPFTKDGAMEALCKKLFDFDKESDVLQSKFTVHQVDMKEQAFNNNIKTIQQIRVPEDYVVINEGTWDCIRTTKPFAFGMMKEVYLMKKQNDTENHLYVIKMPWGGKLYPSMNDAIMECRSHLICKSLMRKFNRDIQDAIEKKGIDKRYPQIQYSDLLILEEGPNQFWIAERFFKGEFVKYNNNYGFIDDQCTDMNKLAQAFSYYTYWSSNYNYMINDVQGVGVYFTDPAINTSQGEYDDTDMGQDGWAMYMVAFDGKKHICKEILDILDIEV